MSINFNKEISIHLQNLKFHEICVYGEYKIEIDVVQKQQNPKTGEIETSYLEPIINSQQSDTRSPQQTKIKWNKAFTISSYNSTIKIDECLTYRFSQSKYKMSDYFSIEIQVAFFIKKKFVKTALKLSDNDTTLNEFHEIKRRKICINKLSKNSKFPIDFALDDLRSFHLEAMVYVYTFCNLTSNRIHE